LINISAAIKDIPPPGQIVTISFSLKEERSFNLADNSIIGIHLAFGIWPYLLSAPSAPLNSLRSRTSTIIGDKLELI